MHWTSRRVIIVLMMNVAEKLKTLEETSTLLTPELITKLRLTAQQDFCRLSNEPDDAWETVVRGVIHNFVCHALVKSR